MITRVCLLVITCFTLVGPVFCQGVSKFYVQTVEVRNESDSRYILERAEAFAPPDKLVTMADISCLLTDLKSSGIFQLVNTQVVTIGDNARKLIITSKYRRGVRRFVLGNLTLVGLPEVDQSRLRSALKEKGISPGVPFLKYEYRELEARVRDALRQVYSDNGSREEIGALSIRLRISPVRKVQLVVSPNLPECDQAATPSK